MLNFFRRYFGAMSDDSSTYLIAGLGNPGQQYKHNRHNVGFMLIDQIAERLQVNFTRLESKALVTRTKFANNRIILAKPQTYMNKSGTAVGSLVRYYKLPLENIFIAFDDVDLDLGTLRIRPKGGSGGQKGVASIINALGTQDFARLRIGIGRPPGRMDAADYVLRDFSREEKELLSEVLERGADAVIKFITDGIDETMNLYNGSVLG